MNRATIYTEAAAGGGKLRVRAASRSAPLSASGAFRS